MPLHLDLATGLLREARQLPSPNQDERPAGTEIDLVVVHGISLPPGDFGGPWIDRLFTNQLPTAGPDAHPYFREIAHLRVSAHFLVHRGGELAQYVPCHRRAWHAGTSLWEGRDAVNDFAVGIELEGTDDTPYEDAQYQRLAELLGALVHAYPEITPERIVGHSDVAPGRKTDPGPSFDWAQLRRLLRSQGRHE